MLRRMQPLMPLGEREDLIVDHHGEGGEGRDEGRGERLQPGVQMAVLAGEIVAGDSACAGSVAFLPIWRAVLTIRSLP